MKESNNDNQVFEKSEKVKCLKLSPSAEGNLTNEQLLSLYIKNLRPVKKENENENGNENKYNAMNCSNCSRRGNINSNVISDSTDSISSYYKYEENGKIEMTSTGNMSVAEAFNLLRYKIKILRKQLTIERKAREEIAEDYMALREEFKNWIERSQSMNENFIKEREASMEKDDYIQLLEEKIKMYENLIKRHNEAYPKDSLPYVNDTEVLMSMNNQNKAEIQI